MKIAIIGNGISGVTAAREIRKKSDAEITLISYETDHFFSRTALMYIYMGHMKYEHTKPYEDWFWEKNRISLLNSRVESIDFKTKKLHTENSGEISYDKLILACGSTPNKFGWKGQDATGVQGLYSFQDLEKLESISEQIEHGVIIGGGLIGIELAEMLRSRGKKVTMLVRESSFWNNVLPQEESILINEHIAEHHIDLRLNTELDEIITTDDNYVKGVKTKGGEVIDAQFAGLTVGVSPNITFLKDTDLKIDRGIIINEFFETNIEDVYAIGDCAQHQNPPKGRRPLEQIWYTGKIMGETLAENIAGNKMPYNPGVFFNSAKFLDIEYQTYGLVPAQVDDVTETFYWKHPKEKILVRLNFDKETRTIVGCNTFGIRMRHMVWDKWISNNETVEFVVENLSEANFDPEFFKRYEGQITSKFNMDYQTDIKPKKKKGLFASLFN